MQSIILNAFGFTDNNTEVTPFGTGLINNTWLVVAGHDKFILQRINHNVFKRPEDIAANISIIGNYLAELYPDYLFVSTKKTLENNDLFFVPGDGYYRLFPFVKNSHTIDVVSSSAQAYEAAKQFGRFTKVLANFPVEKLHITLPNFHNLPLRYHQFQTAIQNGNGKRVKEAGDSILFLQQQRGIVNVSEHIAGNPAFKTRVTHHDTKISNVLFDVNDRGLCVIDLDTVMPNYFISDVGDMLRTYLSPVSEEEKNFSKIEIREDYFRAIAEGYLVEMGDELSDTEKKHFVYAGKFLIYMQALRFLTDYLNDDVYYGSKYEGHNFIRAKNQITLLERFIEQEDLLKELVGF
jgi:Ser/Thr protein kinase RdoA (MazF antagonist)